MSTHVRAHLRIASLIAAATVSGAALASAQIVAPDITSELQTVEQVLAAPEMKKAMAYVNTSDQDTVQDWLAVCNAYGPSGGNEVQRSRLLYKLFRIYGLDDVHIDDANNVIGVRKGTGGGPTVVLNAHHDNVALWPKDQPIQAFVADGRVWCPAAGDDLRGVVQVLSVLRAMNAGNVRTKGDVWFTTFTGEELGSQGAEFFVRANYPLNLDWKKGDIIVQFHGGAGGGMSSGSSNYIHFTQLRVFTPLDRPRWGTDAVDALGPIIARINKEVRDPRSLEIDERGSNSTVALTDDILYLNMSMVDGSAIINGTSGEASIRIDMRSPKEERLWAAHRQIMKIADEVTHEMGPGFTYAYEINMTSGTPGIEGFDKVNNRAAKMGLAAAQILYGGKATVDPTRGCGDCVRAYMGGMPMLSFRGNVIDDGQPGHTPRRGGDALKSEVRRKTAGHDVTESASIVSARAGIKQGLLFAAAYAGLSDAAAAPPQKAPAR
jgi:acetylornithine deacetylase/succinyl-diaminopimelate desuccinylase-like protein